ncbi:MAG TPA: TonB family protein [Pseudomonadales bacterium]|nr:TonB family protein [Pseudomonadales bacterium]
MRSFGSGVRDASGSSLLGSFAFASLVVIVGVLASWVLVKRGSVAELEVASLALDPLPSIARVVRTGGVQTLVEQADLAFAAGRIVEPQYDNALYFYQAALGEAPEEPTARAGVDRIVQWLSGEVTIALDARDWPRAMSVAQHIVLLRPADQSARELLTRIGRIRGLSDEALRLGAQGRHADAADRYRQLLALDEGNIRARDGLRRTLAALVAAGGDAISEGRLDDADRFLAEARAVDPRADQVLALAERLRGAGELAAGTARAARLAAARAALDDGRLLDVDGSDAFSLYAAVLAEKPDDEAALAGLVEARDALLALGRAALRADAFARVESVLTQATRVGVDAADREELARGLRHRRYLVDFAQGRYDDIRSISGLEVLRQEAPAYPRAAIARTDGGWVEVEFTVGIDGRAADMVVRDASSDLFVDASLDALGDWRFAPEQIDGQAVPVRAAVRFAFRS